ncbi:type VI secretion system tube protein TssD, partial [Capnocytophaga sputigena]
MAFKAKLKVAGKEFNILKVSYALFQETDATGRPSSVA